MCKQKSLDREELIILIAKFGLRLKCQNWV